MFRPLGLAWFSPGGELDAVFFLDAGFFAAGAAAVAAALPAFGFGGVCCDQTTLELSSIIIASPLHSLRRGQAVFIGATNQGSFMPASFKVFIAP